MSRGILSKGDFVLGGILSRGILSGGFCPGGFCPDTEWKSGFKLPLTSLHKGHIVGGYLDDLCLQGKTYEECLTNVIDTIKLLEELGFFVHPLKSVLIPWREIEILGLSSI